MNFEIEVTKDINSSRNAINLVHSFTPFKSGIYITKEGRRINAKSILGLLSASIVKGDHIEVEVFDDGRGPVFDTAQSYAINDKIYVTADGVLTNQDGGGQEIGFVTKAPATAVDSMKIQINL